MRVGVHLGPFYASTSTRRRRRGTSPVLPVIGMVALAGWPFAVVHGPAVWAVVIPWWIVLIAAAIAVSAGRQRQRRRG